MSEPQEVELSGDQHLAVERLQAALVELAASIESCDAAGLSPVESFRAVGIEVPGFVAPMLNNLLRMPAAGLVEPEPAPD